MIASSNFPHSSRRYSIFIALFVKSFSLNRVTRKLDRKDVDLFDAEKRDLFSLFLKQSISEFLDLNSRLTMDRVLKQLQVLDLDSLVLILAFTLQLYSF